MLSIANEVNPLIFYYVYFICDTNYVFSTISYLFYYLLLKLSNKMMSFLFISLKLSNKIIKGIFQNDCLFFFLGLFLLSTSQQLIIRFFFFSICFGGYFSYPFFHYLILGSCTSFFIIMKYSYIHNFLIKKQCVFFFLSNIFFYHIIFLLN